MKLISVDLQASHRNPYIATMFEFGAVGFDTETEFSPVTFHRRFVPPETFQCSLEAMIVNYELLNNIRDYTENKLIESEERLFETPVAGLFNEFFSWASVNDFLIPFEGRTDLPYVANVCGKNFSDYDKIILNGLDPNWSRLFSRRSLNVAEYYTRSSDVTVPSLQVCKKRYGQFADDRLSQNSAIHALEVAEMLHHKLSKQ